MVQFYSRLRWRLLRRRESERMMIMVSVTKDTILKKLETLYWSAFHDGKWHIALQALELQGKNIGMFEKPYLPDIMRITGMTEQQRQDLTNARERLDPQLTHPPPLV